MFIVRMLEKVGYPASVAKLQEAPEGRPEEQVKPTDCVTPDRSAAVIVL